MDNNHQDYNNEREMENDEQAPRNAAASNDPSHHEPGAGITNRPDSEELENQQRLPPRGHAKDED
jgi:hypothetical protein